MSVWQGLLWAGWAASSWAAFAERRGRHRAQRREQALRVQLITARQHAAVLERAARSKHR